MKEKMEREEQVMHKVFARRMTALLLSLCMVAGMIDLSGFIDMKIDIDEN